MFSVVGKKKKKKKRREVGKNSSPLLKIISNLNSPLKKEMWGFQQDVRLVAPFHDKGWVQKVRAQLCPWQVGLLSTHLPKPSKFWLEELASLKQAGGSNGRSGIPQQRVNTFISGPKFLGHHTGFSDGDFEVKTITSTSDKTSPIRLFAQGHPDRTDSPTSHFLGMKDHRSANVGL